MLLSSVQPKSIVSFFTNGKDAKPVKEQEDAAEFHGPDAHSQRKRVLGASVKVIDVCLYCCSLEPSEGIFFIDAENPPAPIYKRSVDMGVINFYGDTRGFLIEQAKKFVSYGTLQFLQFVLGKA